MERQAEKKRGGGQVIAWALLLIPWLPWVPGVLLRKQDSAGVSAVGYIYTHPAAQLLSFSHSQTAGERDAFQRDYFLMVFILNFSRMISAFTSSGWRKKKQQKKRSKKGKKINRVGGWSSLLPTQYSVIFSHAQKGELCLPGSICHAASLCLGKDRRDLQHYKVTVSFRDLSFFLLCGQTEQTLVPSWASSLQKSPTENVLRFKTFSVLT